MVRIRDRAAVRGNPRQIQARLESYLASRRSSDGVTRLLLRVPIDSEPRSFCLDREVRLEAWRDRDGVHAAGTIRIRWSPEGTVAFPKFSGTLGVSGSEDPGITHIYLMGTYEPPVGATGAAFDAAIGRKLAESTARALLENVRNCVESRAPQNA